MMDIYVLLNLILGAFLLLLSIYIGMIVWEACIDLYNYVKEDMFNGKHKK